MLVKSCVVVPPRQVFNYCSATSKEEWFDFQLLPSNVHLPSSLISCSLHISCQPVARSVRSVVVHVTTLSLVNQQSMFRMSGSFSARALVLKNNKSYCCFKQLSWITITRQLKHLNQESSFLPRYSVHEFCPIRLQKQRGTERQKTKLKALQWQGSKFEFSFP